MGAQTNEAPASTQTLAGEFGADGSSMLDHETCPRTLLILLRALGGLFELHMFNEYFCVRSLPVILINSGLG
jgi:hypothetical protein